MLDFAQNFIDAYHNLQKQCLEMLPERFVNHLKPEATSHTFDNMTEDDTTDDVTAPAALYFKAKAD